MLKSTLLHPELLRALAAGGHGGRVLVADGNYPLSTRTPPGATRIHLNLRPGLVRVTDVLETLVESVPIEAASVMQPEDGSDPPIFAEFTRLLGGLPMQRLQRFAFYDAAADPNVAVAVATGDERVYANILLTIGVVPPDR